jgi:hypothetical protein
MTAHNASAAALYWSSSGQQMLLSTIQNEGQALVSDTEHASGAGDASIRTFECLLNQVALEMKDLLFKRSVR